MNLGVDPWRAFVIASNVLAGLTLPSVIVQRRGRPLAALGWLLGFLLVPPVAVLAWWIFGHHYLERKRRRRRRRRIFSRNFFRLRRMPKGTGTLLPIKRLPREEATGVFPPFEGNQVRLFIDGDQYFPEMEKMIREAREFVHVLFYIWHQDEVGTRFRDLLIEKARSGVKVRLLVDGIGGPSAQGRFMKPLRESGAEVASFLPPQMSLSNLTINFRNHRKLIVADGKVALSGSFNIGDEYARSWHDVAIRFQGPVVDQFEEVFAEDWYFATDESLYEDRYYGRHTQTGTSECGPAPGAEGGAEGGNGAGKGAVCRVIASGPDMQGNPTHDALFMALNSAQKRIWVTTPYFIPNESILTALRVAVFRGVDVRVMVPGKSDVPFVRLAARSYYPELLVAGVRIFEFLPRMVHAKSILIDDDVSMLGSANIDSRSFRLNFELSSFVKCRTLNQELAALFLRNQERSEEISARRIENQSFIRRFTESLAHICSPLL